MGLFVIKYTKEHFLENDHHTCMRLNFVCLFVCLFVFYHLNCDMFLSSELQYGFYHRNCDMFKAMYLKMPKYETLKQVKSIQLSGNEAIRTQIQPSKQKREIMSNFNHCPIAWYFCK